MFDRYLQCAILSGIFIAAGPLFAQPPGRGGRPSRPQAGTRGAPPTEMILQLFQQADTNNDGSVTRAELTSAMQNQARGDRRGGGGPPPQQDNQAGQPRTEHGAGGGPPQPGQILPEPIAESLNLNKKQTRQLAALQASVDKRLAAILTDEQKKQLENARPPHGPDHVEGEQGERPADRPQRPQRPE